MNTEDQLELQVDEARRTISADGYPMSIGELTNLYRDGELEISPSFQRFFRWNSLQKSRLVESILLGIPLPSIFVSQTPKGTWELVDGLQRVSTILEVQGELKDEGGKVREALTLSGTDYLPELDGRVWESADKSIEIPSALKLDLKRAKLDVKIIKRESSEQAKFDLFHRLNSYGSALTNAEIRSAMLVAASSSVFEWFDSLSRYESFVESVQLSDRLIEERFDLELLARFLVLHDLPDQRLTISGLKDLPRLLDRGMVKIAKADASYRAHLGTVFKETFDLIATQGSDQIFRRWDAKKGQFRGSFSTTAFEIFAVGLGHNFAHGIAVRTDLVSLAKDIWQMPEMQKGFSTGRSSEERLRKFIPLGREVTRA